MSEKQLFEVLQPEQPKKVVDGSCANNFENSNKHIHYQTPTHSLKEISPRHNFMLNLSCHYEVTCLII
jgi:hypothetical protein